MTPVEWTGAHRACPSLFLARSVEQHSNLPSSTLMLNRPRLTKRPSLLDLIQKKNITYISSFSSSRSLFEHDVEPHTVPLPSSPPITPHREDVCESPPPPIVLNERSNEESKERPAAKMGPVSTPTIQGWCSADG